MPAPLTRKPWLSLGLVILLVQSSCAFALGASTLQTDDTTVREATQALLTFLTFSVIPDSTADSLQIDNRTGDDPTVLLSLLGGVSRFRRRSRSTSKAISAMRATTQTSWSPASSRPA